MALIGVLLVVGVFLIVVAIVMHSISEWSCWEAPSVFGVVVLIIGLIVGGIAWHENAYKSLNTQLYRQKHDALVMQLDNNYYNKITYDGRKALIDEVVSYNATVAKGRAKHHSVWIGALYPEDWDSLPLIELENK